MINKQIYRGTLTVVIFLGLLFALKGYAQNEANVWLFGEYSGLDFNHDKPVAITENQVMVAEVGCSSIADNNGNLLFFTNGETIWNSDFEVMMNGLGLFGNANATQSCIIVPFPENDSFYYVFTLDRASPSGEKGLNYSVVDISKHNGGGEVIEKNIPLKTNVSEKLTATLHHNEIDFWVIVHEWESDAFFSYLVTSEGIVPQPIVSHLGSIHRPPTLETPLGSMKVSPDGSKLVLALYSLQVFEFFSFDNTTGVVSNYQSSNSVFHGAYGVAFSPDSRKVYGSTYFINGHEASSYIFQFDLNSTDIAGSAASIPSHADMQIRACAIQLGPDGRIYVSRYGEDSLGVIINPSREGVKCNYVEKFSDLLGRKALAGLPNFIQSYVDIPCFDYERTCFGDTTPFFLNNNDNIDSLKWDFADPLSGTRNISLLHEPKHVFCQPGSYHVKLEIYFEGDVFKNSGEVMVFPLPEVDLGNDLFVFPGSWVTLDPGPGFFAYEWQDEQLGQMYLAREEGTYYVTVRDEHLCKNTDTISIFYLDMLAPNAFTPNADGINDVFMPILPEWGVLDYRMTLFDRWGKIVFDTNDMLEGWDGRHHGKPCPLGTYIWVITFNARREASETVTINEKGIVTLLR
ncbi:MAG: gliding motility-associated C-terminal domain-containing protein [Bacteroidales bacterium]|nr:gliding motility-associated C-terminal domain-containing protein [Bacteroidales bacterium]